MINKSSHLYSVRVLFIQKPKQIMYPLSHILKVAFPCTISQLHHICSPVTLICMPYLISFPPKREQQSLYIAFIFNAILYSINIKHTSLDNFDESEIKFGRCFILHYGMDVQRGLCIQDRYQRSFQEHLIKI